MMAFHIAESGEQLTESELQRVENNLGIKLPNEYCEFILRHNGGKPSIDCFNVVSKNGSSKEYCIHYFYGIGASAAHESLEDAARIFDGRIPGNLIPVADDYFGNQICVVTSGSQFGSVCLWLHELEHYPPSYSNVFRIADTFSSFIEGLHKLGRSWVPPLQAAIERDDVEAVRSCLDESFDVESADSFDRTLIENAAIANAVRVIEWLHSRGATLRNALQLAEQNAVFFPDHKRAVQLLRRLYFKN